LADLLAERGRAAEADEIYQRVYAADRSNPWAAYRAGTAAAERGDTATAARILMTLARNPYAQKKASAALATLHRREGRVKDAEGFEYASSLLPPDRVWPNPFADEVAALQRGPRVLVETVTQFEQQGNYAAAVATANRLVDLYPSPKNQLLLGRSLVSLKKYDAAIPVLEDTIHGDPGLVMAYAFLGTAWFERGERADTDGRRADANGYYVKAIAALDKAVELKSDYAAGYYYRARALARLDRLDDAQRAIRAFLDRRPEEWEGYIVLGNVLEAAGKKGDAIAALEQAVKLANPNEPRPRQALEKLQGRK
jgi:tetratricopeptide (TPR) repeat protein